MKKVPYKHGFYLQRSVLTLLNKQRKIVEGLLQWRLLSEVIKPPTFHCLSLSLNKYIYKIQNVKKSKWTKDKQKYLISLWFWFLWMGRDSSKSFTIMLLYQKCYFFCVFYFTHKNFIWNLITWLWCYCTIMIIIVDNSYLL